MEENSTFEKIRSDMLQEFGDAGTPLARIMEIGEHGLESKKHLWEMFKAYDGLMDQISAWVTVQNATRELMEEKGFHFKDMLPLFSDDQKDAFKHIADFDINEAFGVQVRAGDFLDLDVPEDLKEKHVINQGA